MSHSHTSAPYEGIWLAAWMFLLATWTAQFILCLLYPAPVTKLYAAGLFGAVAAGIGARYCQEYKKKNSAHGELCTKGPYAIVRHPIYHMIMASSLCFPLVVDWHAALFWVMWAIFFVSAVTACILEEGVVRATWGKEAEQYYKKTPRFIFEWIWFRKPHAQ